MLEEIKKEFEQITKQLFVAEICDECNGTGDDFEDSSKNCGECSGIGTIGKLNPALWQFIEQKLTEAIKQAKIVDYLEKQKEWSSKTFGNGKRTLGIIKHIQKELIEIEECPEDLQEWIDVIILAMDGYWRHGGNAKDLMERLIEKQCINFNRDYPFPTSEDLPSEHIRINELKGDK